jgi:hypothetical protein
LAWGADQDARAEGNQERESPHPLALSSRLRAVVWLASWPTSKPRRARAS